MSLIFNICFRAGFVMEGIGELTFDQTTESNGRWKANIKLVEFFGDSPSVSCTYVLKVKVIMHKDKSK